MIGRIARGGFFTGKSSCDIGQSGAKQLVAAVALMPLLILFAAYTAALTRTAFQWSRQPPNIAPSPSGILGPHLIHGSLGPCESDPQTASRSVQPFLGSLVPNRQIDKQTDRQTTLNATSVAMCRIYVTNAMRPKILWRLSVKHLPETPFYNRCLKPFVNFIFYILTLKCLAGLS